MASSQIDMAFGPDISLEDRYGVAIGLRRPAQVTGLDVEGAADGDKFLILWEAFDAVGVTPGSKCTDHDNLVLAGRTARLIDVNKAMVELTYEHFMVSDSQNLGSPVHGELFYRTTSSLDTVETQKDGAGLQITVTHIYPDDGKESLKYAGTAVVQGGMISVTEARKVKTLVGILATDAPDDVTDGLINKVNSEPWQSGAATTYKCTAASHEPWDLESDVRTHRFFFEFRHDPNGHDPDVIFRDEDTGLPPTGLTDDGAKTVVYYGQTDFNNYFQPGGMDPEPD